jgi:conjugative relaxase-like TrwC/TraI family protein
MYKLGNGRFGGEYYIAPRQRGGESFNVPKPRGASDYYTAEVGDDPPGKWSVIGHWADAPVHHNGLVDADEFRTVCAGINPRTGVAMVRDGHKTVHHRDGSISTESAHVAGFDVEMDVPKPVSALIAVARLQGRQDLVDKIEGAIHKSTAAALDYGLDVGAFQTRLRGPQGMVHQKVAAIIVGCFQHSKSREGDPQAHEHPVVANAALLHDGTTGALDSRNIMQWEGAMKAHFRTTLCGELRDLGFDVEKEERNFTVKGVDEGLCDTWSKRARQIEAEARRKGFDKARDRGQAQLAALRTRIGKESEPWEVTQTRWSEEMTACKLTPQQALSDAFTAGKARALDKAALRAEGIDDAFKQLHATQMVFDEMTMQRVFLEHLQVCGDPAMTRTIIEDLLQQGRLVFVGPSRDGEPRYSTPELIALEREMLRGCIERRGALEGAVSHEIIERVIAKADADMIAKVPKSKGLNAKQKEAIRVGLNGDGVALYEGSAGVGKTTSAKPIVEGWQAAGYRVIGLAPSDKAKNVLAGDASIPTGTVQGFVKGYLRGKIKLGPNDVLFVDEAGMVPTADMNIVVRAARKANCKLIITGDSRQLDPVGAGSAFAAIARELPGARVVEIVRQEKGWQRGAAEKMASGHVSEALKDYDARGQVDWIMSRDDALDRVAELFRKHIQEHPEQTRSVTTGRHADILELNRRLREVYRDEGLLERDEVILKTAHKDGKIRECGYSRGERVIFTEIVSKFDLSNGDQGTLLNIEPITWDAKGNVVDAQLTIRLDKNGGQIIEAKMSELVGWRDKKDKNPRPICMQYGTSCTSYAMQGATVDFNINFIGAAQNAREGYVNSTRHRKDCITIVDGERVMDELRAGFPRGEWRTLTLDDVKKQVFKEVDKPGGRENVSDYISKEKRTDWILERHEFAPAAPGGEQQHKEPLKAPVSDEPGARPADANKKERTLKLDEEIAARTARLHEIMLDKARELHNGRTPGGPR